MPSTTASIISTADASLSTTTTFTHSHSQAASATFSVTSSLSTSFFPSLTHTEATTSFTASPTLTSMPSQSQPARAIISFRVILDFDEHIGPWDVHIELI